MDLNSIFRQAQDILNQTNNTIVPTPRRTQIQVEIKGKDYSAPFSASLISFEYSENLVDPIDSADFLLEDHDHIIRNEIQFQRGDLVKFQIQMFNAPGTRFKQTDEITMWIDTLEYRLSPHTVKIRASSIHPELRVKGERGFARYEGKSLSALIQSSQVKKGNDPEKYGHDTPLFGTEQTNQSKLEAYMKIAKAQGKRIKVINGLVEAISIEEWEKNGKLIANISDSKNKADNKIINGTLTTSSIGLLKSVKINTYNPTSGEGYTKEVTMEGTPQAVSSTATVRTVPPIEGTGGNAKEDPEKYTQALEKAAKYKLRDANSYEYRLSMDLVGDIDLRLGRRIILTDTFGKMWAGPYLIESADHRIDSNGYVVSIKGYKITNETPKFASIEDTPEPEENESDSE